MRLELREFRMPIILTVLILGMITYWTWQTWYQIDEHEIGKSRSEAVKISGILLGVLSALDQNGHPGREEIERRFGPILEASSYQFFILKQDGRSILQVGRVPSNLPASFEKKAFFLNDMFIFTRESGLPVESPQDQDLYGGFAGSGSMKGRYLLIMGKQARDGKISDGPPQKFFEHIVFPFMAVLLLLCANAAAWLMVIRNRSLFEQLEIERARSAHLEDLGLAAAGLAHETKNPLGIISGIAQQVARDPQVPEKSRAMLETIVDEIDKSVSRLGLFMTFAKKRDVTAVPVDACSLIESVAGVLAPEFEAAGIYPEMECRVRSIMADPEMLRQILVNLILNSLSASSRGSSITVRLERKNSHAVLEVEDHGCGISEEMLPRIFKPYVTGNPDGHGLGLSIVKRFAEDHGWSVSAQSQPGRGTVIRITGIGIWEKPGDA